VIDLDPAAVGGSAKAIFDMKILKTIFLRQKDAPVIGLGR